MLHPQSHNRTHPDSDEMEDADAGQSFSLEPVVRIGDIGDYDPSNERHVATTAAVKHASRSCPSSGGKRDSALKRRTTSYRAQCREV